MSLYRGGDKWLHAHFSLQQNQSFILFCSESCKWFWQMLMNEKEQTLIVVKYFDFSFLWLDFAQNRYSYHLPDIHPSNMYSISQPENVQGYIMTKKMQSYTFCDSDFIHTHSTGALSTASFCYTFSSPPHFNGKCWLSFLLLYPVSS